MSIRATVCKGLLLLALVGLVLTPFARPAGAKALPTAHAGMAMPDGMPCCPDGLPAKDCPDKTCPLMNLCMATALSALLPVGTLALPNLVAASVRLADDAGVAGLASGPPPRPPKA